MENKKKQKFKFTMDFVIQKDYELEAENEDDAEALALADFKERHLINVNPDDVDGFAKFKKEDEC